MTFRARRDAYFIKFISIVLIISGIVILLPLLDNDLRAPGFIIFTCIFLILCEGFILWIIFDIKYTFLKDHLYVKGGPFRSEIPYKEITKVGPASNIFIGYRILSARYGLKIYYKTGMWESVQISPENQTQFVAELQARSPDISINLE